MRPHDEMQAGREQNRDQHIDAEHQRVRLRAGKKRQAQQDEQHKNARNHKRARSRADRRFDGGAAAHGDLRTPKQALRTGDQHNRHHQKFGDQRELGKIHGDSGDADKPDADTERLDLGDQNGRDI
jgi:hypothetical protein